MADRPLWSFLTAVAVAAFSWMLVGIIRRYSVARGILDQPGPRSSHGVPTPRGGGAGLLVASVAGFVVLTSHAGLDWRIGLGLLAVLLVAAVGWVDDRTSMSVSARVATHVAAGFLLAPMAIGDEVGAVAVLLVLGCVFATVAAINVINFMDGIDGIIGMQALVFGAHLVLAASDPPVARHLGLTLAAGAIGFLIWNWPPARIFLGDVGSGGLAVFALVGGLLAWRYGGWPFIPVFLPLFAIFLDAATTLVRRATRGERIARPHRSHLYQRLANEAGWGHARVTLLYGGVAAIGSVVAMLALEGRAWAWLTYAATVATLGWLLDRAMRGFGPGPASAHAVADVTVSDG